MKRQSIKCFEAFLAVAENCPVKIAESSPSGGFLFNIYASDCVHACVEYLKKE